MRQYACPSCYVVKDTQGICQRCEHNAAIDAAMARVDALMEPEEEEEPKPWWRW